MDVIERDSFTTEDIRFQYAERRFKASRGEKVALLRESR
ncbi:hypothetical protein LPN04_17325 [Rugamonas sp. A1-17]|nr:hypothetical protein [Rugamonas sp. A1-17]